MHLNKSNAANVGHVVNKWLVLVKKYEKLLNLWMLGKMIRNDEQVVIFDIEEIQVMFFWFR